MVLLLEGNRTYALDKIVRVLNRELRSAEYSVVKNLDRVCVDVFNSDGYLCAQCYPTYEFEKNSYSSLERVDPQDVRDGDVLYRRVTRDSSRKVYSSNNIEIKFMRDFEDPQVEKILRSVGNVVTPNYRNKTEATSVVTLPEEFVDWDILSKQRSSNGRQIVYVTRKLSDSEFGDGQYSEDTYGRGDIIQEYCAFYRNDPDTPSGVLGYKTVDGVYGVQGLRRDEFGMSYSDMLSQVEWGL